MTLHVRSVLPEGGWAVGSGVENGSHGRLGKLLQDLNILTTHILVRHMFRVDLGH